MTPRDERRPIRYTVHAAERLVQRGVTTDQVDAVIRSGGWQKDGIDTFVSHIRQGGRPPLQVVFADKGAICSL